MLGLLWIWQEASSQITVRTVAYSEFKGLVRDGRVEEATIKDTEIVGKVKPAAQVQDPAAAPAHSNGLSATLAARPGTNKAGAPAQPDPARTNSPPLGTFLFRTVRVEDPDLVRDLEKARVRFTGMRPSFLSQFLLAWVLPIAVMILLWRSKSFRTTPAPKPM